MNNASSNTTHRLLIVVLAMQGLLLLGQWTGAAFYGTPAGAQAFGDSGGRQLQMIDELKAIHASLDKVAGILSDGSLQVRVARPDEDKGKAH